MKSSMSYLIILLGLSLLAVFVFSCKSKEKALTQQNLQKNLTEEEIRQLPKLLSYSKSPCYGYCPHFDMTVYEGGWTIFEGKRYTATSGTAIFKMSEEQLDTMLQQCHQADIWSAEAAYGMRVQDLPTTTVHVYEKNRDKAVQWRMRHPDRLQQLDKQLMAFVTAQGWVTPRKISKNEAGDKRSEAIIDNELIVQLRDKLDGTNWVEKYAKYGMHLKKPISKLANMYLFIFDTESIGAEEMLEIVLKDENEARAEFNKRLQSRSR